MKFKLNGLLFVANCGEPPSVLRATINPGGTHEGDRRAYLCNQQTVTEGNTEIYCQTNGQWSSTNLYCRREYITIFYLQQQVSNR